MKVSEMSNSVPLLKFPVDTLVNPRNKRRLYMLQEWTKQEFLDAKSSTPYCVGRYATTTPKGIIS
jgi:hypothetical protein